MKSCCAKETGSSCSASREEDECGIVEQSAVPALCAANNLAGNRCGGTRQAAGEPHPADRGGGLGSPAGYYLAAAGIGTLGLVDGDTLELSNLQRQIAHTTADLGRSKVASAARTFTALNPDVRINAHNLRLTAGNAPGLFKEYDFIIDATDNFESKFLIAEACHAAGKPYSHAGILKFICQTLTVIPGKTACLCCVFGELPPGNKEPPQGPLGVVPGVIGTIQATEAICFNRRIHRHEIRRAPCS